MLSLLAVAPCLQFRPTTSPPHPNAFWKLDHARTGFWIDEEMEPLLRNKLIWTGPDQHLYLEFWLFGREGGTETFRLDRFIIETYKRRNWKELQIEEESFLHLDGSPRNCCLANLWYRVLKQPRGGSHE